MPIRSKEAKRQLTSKQDLEEEQTNEDLVDQNLYHRIKKVVRAAKFGSIVDLGDVVAMATNVRTLFMTMENLDGTTVDSLLVQCLLVGTKEEGRKCLSYLSCSHEI